MHKNNLLILVLTVIALTAYLTLAINTSLPKSVSKAEMETAINQAKYLYRQQKETGRDFSKGPCLSDALMPNWVLDIAHHPRLPIDNLPQNMCPAYFEGRAQHFVELDPEGNLIRAK